MAPVRHVSGAGEWLDGAVGDGGMQEDRQEDGQEDRRCAGGVKRGEKEGGKLGS